MALLDELLAKFAPHCHGQIKKFDSEAHMLILEKFNEGFHPGELTEDSLEMIDRQKQKFFRITSFGHISEF